MLGDNSKLRCEVRGGHTKQCFPFVERERGKGGSGSLWMKEGAISSIQARETSQQTPGAFLRPILGTFRGQNPLRV